MYIYVYTVFLSGFVALISPAIAKPQGKGARRSTRSSKARVTEGLIH